MARKQKKKPVLKEMKNAPNSNNVQKRKVGPKRAAKTRALAAKKSAAKKNASTKIQVALNKRQKHPQTVSFSYLYFEIIVIAVSFPFVFFPQDYMWCL